MKKTLILGILTFFSTASLVSAAPSFSDVASNHIHVDAIAYVQDQKIVSGNPDGTFAPDIAITRAAFTKIVVEALGLNTETLCRIAPFPDVPSDQWYYKYVMAARCAGLIGGYPDGTFQPGATMNFVELAKIVSEGFNLHPATGLSTWYEGYVLALESNAAIPVQIAAFDSVITRGQMAEIIYRIHGNVHYKPSRTYNDMAGISSSDDEADTSTIVDDALDDLDFFEDIDSFDDWLSDDALEF